LTARLAAWARERATDPPPITPERSCASREQLEAARCALARLSPRKREVFVMVVLEGLAAEDAARTLGIPVGTVFTRLHHARREIRGHFAAVEANE
jgi:RNA polymerase sigma-70 factor (ECF subfamily)